MQQTTSSQENF